MSVFDIDDDTVQAGEETLDVQGLLNSGWQMRDLPWMLPKYFDGIINAFGDKEVIILAGSRMPRGPEGKKELCSRAQIIVSPKGFENLKAWKESGGIEKLG